MTTKLKPCPFCGNAAAWCDEHNKDEPHECHHIVCTACNAQFDMSGSYNPETLAELKDYCGKRFNTRTEQASQPQVPQVPEGFKLVPLEPTPLMTAAGRELRQAGYSEIAIYDAMLMQAPYVALHMRKSCGNCHKCLPGYIAHCMFLCPECGNKRCPKASDHELACTNSNEPGQPGSVYE